MKTLVPLAILMLLNGVATGGSPLERLSVCEVLEGAGAYNGKLLTLRGEYKSGAHGSFLVAPPSCTYRLITKRVQWPNLVYVTFPIDRVDLEDYHADFEVDWKAVNKANERIGRAKFDVKVACLVESVTGRFVAMRAPEKMVNPPELGGNILGFGPVGLGAPAQLLIKSMGLPEIVQRGSADGQGVCAP